MFKFLQMFPGLMDMIPDGTYFVPSDDIAGGDKPSHTSDGTTYDQDKFKGVADPLGAAATDVSTDLNKDDDTDKDKDKPKDTPSSTAGSAATDDPPPAKKADDPPATDDPPASDKKLEDLIDSEGIKYGEDGFDQDKLSTEDYGVWLGSLDSKATMEELDRVVGNNDKNLDDIEVPLSENAKKYSDLAKKYQAELKAAQDKATQDKDAPPKDTPPANAPVRLTIEDLAKEMGMEVKTFQELPENLRQGFQKAIEDKAAAAAQASKDAEEVKVQLQEAKEKLVATTKEAKSAFNKRDAFKQQLRHRTKEVFNAAAKEVGIPDDLMDLAYTQAKFTDKNKKGIPLRQVFANLKQTHPSLFRNADPAKPKPGTTGSGTGSTPPKSTQTPEQIVNYREYKGDPLQAAASAVSRDLAKELSQ